MLFLCLLWLWRLSVTSEFLPESSRDHRVKNNLHFDHRKKAELHFSVMAALSSRPCCGFIITRKPQSSRLMTEKPIGSYWNTVIISLSTPHQIHLIHRFVSIVLNWFFELQKMEWDWSKMMIFLKRSQEGNIVNRMSTWA